LLTLTSTVLSLAVAEIGLRVFLPSKRPVYQLEGRYLYKPTPNASRILRRSPINGGEKIVVRFNSFGFRGEEFSNPPSHKRIVVYGDSFIEADASQLDNTFAKKLEKELAVEVINAGVIGYGPDQVALRMESELDSMRPDLVITSIYVGNDYGDLLRNKLYRLDSNGRLYEAPHVLGASIYEQFKAPSRIQLYEKTKNLLARFWEQPQPNINLGQEEEPGPSEFPDFCLREAKKQYEDYGNNEIHNLLGDIYDADISLSPTSASARLKIQLMEQTLLHIKEIAETHHTPILILIIPAAIDSCHDYEVKIDTTAHPEYSASRLTDILESIVEKNGIRHVNLFEPFKASKVPLYFHYPNDHWNDEAQELAAHAVAGLVLSGDLLLQSEGSQKSR
jgi:hypothetical protein